MSPSGLSWVGQEYFRCLSANGFDVTPVLIAPPEAVEYVDMDIAERMLAAAVNGPPAASIHFHAGRACDFKVAKGAIMVLASIVVEGNRLNDEQIAVCRKVDGVLVPSRFCWNVCVSSGIPRGKVFYVPYPLHGGHWNPGVPPETKSDRFRFLSMNTWYERKGWDVLLKAWWEEFSIDDPVELVVKSYMENDRSRSLEPEIAGLAKRLGVNATRRGRVSVVDKLIPHSELPGFMKSHDAFVSPHRSEGLGLNPWLAMSLGIPVIATDYGGVTDFAKHDTAWLVKADRSSPGKDELRIFPHLAGITWAEPDVAELRRQMRACLANSTEAKRRAENGLRLVRSLNDPKTVAELFRQSILRTSPSIAGDIRAVIATEDAFSQKSDRFESTDKPVRMIEI